VIGIGFLGPGRGSGFVYLLISLSSSFVMPLIFSYMAFRQAEDKGKAFRNPPYSSFTKGGKHFLEGSVLNPRCDRVYVDTSAGNVFILRPGSV
jgi:hypothetical protein